MDDRWQTVNTMPDDKLMNVEHHLEGHEFVVRLWSPGVDFDAISQRYGEEFDSLVLHCRQTNKHVTLRYRETRRHTKTLWRLLHDQPTQLGWVDKGFTWSKLRRPGTELASVLICQRPENGFLLSSHAIICIAYAITFTFSWLGYLNLGNQ